MERLETLAGLSQEDAREVLLHKVDEELTHEKAVRVAAYETDLKENCDNIARNLIGQAVSRCAADHCSETTVSVVPLPSDEMKGRIIGREGRNIRALETATGVDLIIDDTPEAITLSSFDQTRREVARMTLERLIGDGRIHPARIEETVEKCRHDLELQMKREGERAVMELGIHGLHPDLIKLIGRLKYRTSFGQNALTHSMEVAWLAGLLAGEMGVNVTLARRAGLLHDIGKALDHEIEGSHVQIGVDICRKYKENTQIIHAIEAHHGDVEPKTPLAFIIQAADAISAARPGARRENVESYVKRLENLEEISSSFEGVEQAFAVQAGREVYMLSDIGQVVNAAEIIAGEKPVTDLGVTAVDDKTLEVQLNVPVSYFLSLMYFPTFYPVNEAFYNTCKDTFGTSPDTVLSNGAFKLTDYQPAATAFTLEKNPDYYDAAKIALDGLAYQVIKDSQQALMSYQTGALDMTLLNGEQVDQVKDDPEFTSVGAGYLWYISPNIDAVPELANLNLRRAMTFALDRDAITNDVLKDGSTPAYTAVPAQFATGPDGSDFSADQTKFAEFCAYDPTRLQSTTSCQG